jgi:hypothetical protein
MRHGWVVCGCAVLQEADEHATLEEILSIQLTRQKLEQWHNEVGRR